MTRPRPGTNYNARMVAAPSLGRFLAAVAAGEALCAAGEHDQQTVPATRRVYGPYGVHWPTGTRYCSRCKTVLSDPGGTIDD